jgi:subtilisin family serine protease
VVIAVLDTGVDGAHDDLRGRLTSGYDFVNNDADPTDDQGHGTATAGILGAAANNATGVAGTCWTCVLMPVKVLNANNWGPWSVISNGITYAADHGADIISMSIYGTTGSTTLQNAVAYARNKGVLVVVAAGNDGTATPSYPASYPGALAVAGSDSSDRLYSWSDYGSWVDVAAPGCAYTTQRSGGYWNFCGTSTATPIVAGVAGLMLAANPLATATQLEEALESSAVGIGSGVAYGRVDASRALAAVSTSGPAPAPTPTTSPTASPAPTPSASPSASPSAPATTQTFSGSLTNKSPSRAFQVTAGDGALQASLSSAKSATLTLQILDAAGKAVAQATGTSTVAVQSSVAAGTYTLVASSAQRTSFSLTATVPNP